MTESTEMAAKRSRLDGQRLRKAPRTEVPRSVTRRAAQVVEKSSQENWTFLSNHSHVLVALAENPRLSLREVSLLVGVTERSVQRIVTDLEEAGYITKEKVGRNNQYSIKEKIPLRHPLEKHCTVGQLLDLIVDQR
jgi:DNA-binding transcriptional ArsR family regulator